MKKLAALIIVLVAAYVAYPYFALYRLGEASRGRDIDAIESKVDWPRVRQGVKDDVDMALEARIKPDAGNRFAVLGMALADGMTSRVVDAAVTPAGLVAALAVEKPTLAALAAQLYATPSVDRPLPHLVASGFGGLTAFDATVMPDDATSQDDAIRLRFELENGYWMLTRLHLPSGLH
jgi:hypothetical protein